MLHFNEYMCFFFVCLGQDAARLRSQSSADASSGESADDVALKQLESSFPFYDVLHLSSVNTSFFRFIFFFVNFI